MLCHARSSDPYETVTCILFTVLCCLKQAGEETSSNRSKVRKDAVCMEGHLDV